MAAWWWFFGPRCVVDESGDIVCSYNIVWGTD